MVSVPNARAAIPAGPLARNTSVDAEFLGHDQDGGVDLARRARDRRHDHGYVGHAGHNRRSTELHEHRRVRGLPLGMNSPALAMGVTFSPTRQARFGFEAPVPPGSCSLKRRTLPMPSRMALSSSDETVPRAAVNSSSLTVKLGRVDVATVELFERPGYGLVTVAGGRPRSARLFPAQPRVEDLVEATCHDGLTLL